MTDDTPKQPDAQTPQAQLDRIASLRVRIINAIDGLDAADGRLAVEEACGSLQFLYGWKWGTESRMVDLNAKRFPCWISTEERLPPIGENVILAFRYENGEIGSALGCLYPDLKWWAQDGATIFELPVTHWIALPLPPEKGEAS